MSGVSVKIGRGGGVWSLGAAAMLLISGCSAFKAPSPNANGPTVATGTYDSKAEQWQDEALAAQRKAEKEKNEKALKSLDQKR